jgi:hypothetical protein
MLQKKSLGTLGHAPQAPDNKHGDLAHMKHDPRTAGQHVFRGLVSKGHHSMIKHGIGRGTINRRGG